MTSSPRRLSNSRSRTAGVSQALSAVSTSRVETTPTARAARSMTGGAHTPGGAGGARGMDDGEPRNAGGRERVHGLRDGRVGADRLQVRLHDLRDFHGFSTRMVTDTEA